MFRKRVSAAVIIVLLLGIQTLSSEQINSAESEDESSGSKSFLEILFKNTVNGDLIEKIIDDADDAAKTDKAAETDKAEPTPVPPVKQNVEQTIEVKQLASEELSAIVREVFVVETQGVGWTLEEFSDADGEATDNLKYNGREYIGGRTVFSFYPYTPGGYIVHIRKADYSANLIEKKSFIISVEDLPAEEVSDSAPIAVQERGELMPEENLSSSTETESVEESVEDKMQAAERLAAAGDCVSAAGILEECLEIPGYSRADEALFRLAGYYESCSGIRDERKAIKYYQKIVDYYPVSIYWVESKARIIYLQRNFIYIR